MGQFLFKKKSEINIGDAAENANLIDDDDDLEEVVIFDEKFKKINLTSLQPTSLLEIDFSKEVYIIQDNTERTNSISKILIASMLLLLVAVYFIGNIIGCGFFYSFRILSKIISICPCKKVTTNEQKVTTQ